VGIPITAYGPWKNGVMEELNDEKKEVRVTGYEKEVTSYTLRGAAVTWVI